MSLPGDSGLSEAWRVVRKDRWLLALLTWVPLLTSLFLYATLSSALPRDLPIAIVDQDRSSLSRQFARYLNASPGLRLAAEYANVSESQSDLSAGRIYALVVVPAGFRRDAAEGRAPSIKAFYNAQFLLIAKSIRSALLGIEAQFSVEVDVARTLPEIPVLQGALATDLPIRLQTTSLYNNSLNYAQFLLPGMLAALLQVLGSSACILLLSKGLTSARGSGPLTGGRLKGSVGLCAVAFLLHGMLMLFVCFAVLGWPRQGAVVLLLPALFAFVLSSALLGAFFLAAAREPVRALSIAGAFSAPAFAFLGVTFPAADMSGFAQGWRDLMPASHFVDVYVSRIDYGASPVGLPGLVMILVVLLALCPWMLQRLTSGES